MSTSRHIRVVASLVGRVDDHGSSMKRKRKARGEHGEAKRAKIETNINDKPTWPLLRYYYPNVSTLRQYLAAKLSKTSKKRCRTSLRYGHDVRRDDVAEVDEALLKLLDETVVGSFTGTESLDLDVIDRDITVFTQQLSDTTATITATQGALKQSEVGQMFFFVD